MLDSYVVFHFMNALLFNQLIDRHEVVYLGFYQPWRRRDKSPLPFPRGPRSHPCLSLSFLPHSLHVCAAQPRPSPGRSPFKLPPARGPLDTLVLLSGTVFPHFCARCTSIFPSAGGVSATSEAITGHTDWAQFPCHRLSGPRVSLILFPLPFSKCLNEYRLRFLSPPQTYPYIESIAPRKQSACYSRGTQMFLNKEKITCILVQNLKLLPASALTVSLK